MSQTRVLFLTGSLNLGGTERNILHLATHLDPERFAVEVWSDYEGEPLQAELRRHNIICRALKGTHSLGQPLLKRIFLKNLPYQWRLFRMLRANRTAVAHAFGFPMAYYAVILGWLAGCRKIVFAVQDWDVWKRGAIYRLLDRICSRLARHIIADGEGARRLAIEKQGMSDTRLITLYDGVNVEELMSNRPVSEIRRELGLAEDRPAIGVIARLDLVKKGQDIFLEALPEIAKAVPEAQFILVGDGPDRDRIEQLAEKLPAEIRPLMAGFRTDLADVTRALDVLVISSRWESVPKILLEGMWLRRAVVATAVGDIEEILDDSCGVLVPADNPTALAAAVARVAADADLRERLGNAAHERIVARGLTLDASVRQYEKLYSSI